MAANPYYACQAEQPCPAARSINPDTPERARTGMNIASGFPVGALLITKYALFLNSLA